MLALALQWTSGQTTFEYFSPWFCFKFRFCTISRAWPVGVIGVSRQALAGPIRESRVPEARLVFFEVPSAITVTPDSGSCHRLGHWRGR